MSCALRRYEFSERLAELLGESRRDLRSRVTMMVSGGVVKPGPRGRGSPFATPAYGARLLVGTMAAPQQAHTIEAIRCYWRLMPVAMTPEIAGPGIIVGLPAARAGMDIPNTLPIPFGRLSFGECVTRLLELSLSESARAGIAGELLGIWVNRSAPVAGLQIGVWSEGRRSVVTQRFESSGGERLPAWLDPDQDGIADPGLLHTVFLPARKLIEIGMLTTLEEKDNPMLNLSPKIAKLTDLVNLVRQGNHHGQWEKLLSALSQVQAWTNKIGPENDRLIEVTDFGSNPGELRMFTHVPENLAPGAPLVVALHGCTQTAAAYDQGAGWSELADRFGFTLLFPQQNWTNNPLRCFNWFRPEDTARDSGEPMSIRQMIETMAVRHGIDRRRIYVTGLSSGGAMTSVMLATYPDVFAGGAIVAGVPYHAANGLQEAFESIFTGASLSEDALGDRVRAASTHRGPWPRVSVWHGDADAAVAFANAEQNVKQWLHVHGLPANPAVEAEIHGGSHGARHRAWQGPEGETLVESYTIVGMSHGQPLNVDADDDADDKERSCGTAGPFFNDVGISSTHRIAQFWDLPMTAREEPVKERFEEAGAAGVAEQTGQEILPAEPLEAEPLEAEPLEAEPMDNPAGAPLGIDVGKIITQSLGMAGLLKDTDHNATGTGPTAQNAPLGIDIPGIIFQSLKAANVLAESYTAAPEAQAPQTHPTDKSQWQGEGWEFIANRSRDARQEPILFGYASSGNDCEIGNRIQSVSREVSLGDQPALSYIRRLQLNAAVNDYTRARFSVLVDGLPVDEVSVMGMEHAEGEWRQRSGIDLAPFANRTVTLTFQVAAHSNVCNEVFAKAWVDRVHVGNDSR